MAKKVLKSTLIDTKLGRIIAISDDNALYLLEFTDNFNLHINLQYKIDTLKLQAQSEIILGETKLTSLIKSELDKYFYGELKKFTIPVQVFGTNFQRLVWKELKSIVYGETCSYLKIALAIGNRSASRAVARANSANRIAIIIPCHRVINKNGNLGGYFGGLERKAWLLNHEKTNK